MIAVFKDGQLYVIENNIENRVLVRRCLVEFETPRTTAYTKLNTLLKSPVDGIINCDLAVRIP